MAKNRDFMVLKWQSELKYGQHLLEL